MFPLFRVTTISGKQLHEMFSLYSAPALSCCTFDTHLLRRGLELFAYLGGPLYL